MKTNNFEDLWPLLVKRKRQRFVTHIGRHASSPIGKDDSVDFRLQAIKKELNSMREPDVTIVVKKYVILFGEKRYISDEEALNLTGWTIHT